MAVFTLNKIEFVILAGYSINSPVLEAIIKSVVNNIVTFIF